jgi:GNAT superfamily N-acetyltransferase
LSKADHRPLKFSSLCSTDCIEDFSCGVAEIDKWFRNNGQKDHGKYKHIVTCVYFADDTARPVGFYALSTVAQPVVSLPIGFYNPFFGDGRHYPAMHLVYLAVAKPYQGQRIGQAMMARVIREFAVIGETIGIPVMTLTPISEKVTSFYGLLGFKKFNRGTGMFLPFATALEARDQTRLLKTPSV